MTLTTPTRSAVPSAAGEPLLSVRELRTTFPIRSNVLRRKVGEIGAVDGVSFDIMPGETYGLVGESGSGKSTVARTIIGLETPTSGTIRFDGRDLTTVRGAALKSVRRDIQMIFQDPHASLNPRRTVVDIVSEGWQVQPGFGPRGSWRQSALELLDRVGLNPDHADRYPHQFSGGQRQRIGIARALAMRPKLIICDEAVSALDVSIQAQVLNLLQDLQAEMGLSYLFIAHDLAVVRHISDQVGVMYLGKLVESGSYEQIFAEPLHPYTQALLSAIPVTHPWRQDRRERIVLSGDIPSPADPPSGCRFRTRCWMARDICAESVPALARRGHDHPDACHLTGEPE
ncbi:ATP-binding cassette domain-containing protein [Protaetiibacter sp. SSC-01]|uniref:ABC transporter ATP-binding protein n=1 Tax=Protaetiibacter sp. SSC-01 TaxID=2759943 RepID=UPI0016570533|nr:oligopeptide/dipeptide ABC transporter ATP-binding protein [Protaetiibacter sp. SSC-01]QNO37822.1 ATP-binding cassette domain-containing protein [Protaetiibacter sp. SSC-01]